MNIIEKAKLWTKFPFDKKTQKLVQKLISSNSRQIEDAFYKDLDFGTGGVRAVVGVGTNRLNKYTLGKSMQGLSNYLKNKFFFKNKISIVIAYDVRNHSKEFSKIVTNVLTANQIYVNIFDNFRTTPQLSFAVRYLKCEAGIIITASHNLAEYQGYKIYLNDGAQITSPHDQEIIQQIKKTTFSDIKFKAQPKLIKILNKEIDAQFIKNSLKFGSYKNDANANLKVVFTPIHGTTIHIIPNILKKAKFNFLTVEEQAFPNGNFPTVKSPNPEEIDTLSIAINKGNQISADLVIGTDPDGDRFGIAARNKKGKFEILNGNQTNTLLTNYLLNIWKKEGKITGNEFIGSTIVTSDIFFELAKYYGVECKTSLTGFKWIGKMIHDYEGIKKFICGGEESCGFMIEDFIRDKDSITSTLLACEVAAQAKKNKKTLFDILADIYIKTNFYLEDLITIDITGTHSMNKMKFIMNSYRTYPPQELSGFKVTHYIDYQNSIYKNCINNSIKKILMPQSNVLIFYTENGTKIACRPSGTEPKIKYYFSVKLKLPSTHEYEKIKKNLKKEIEKLKKIILIHHYNIISKNIN